jgi:PKD repeat protein
MTLHRIKIAFLGILVFGVTIPRLLAQERSSRIVRNPESERPSGVNSLISVHWDQNCFYNAKCPVDTASTTPCFHAFAGSGAVAMAQIMKYYNYPPHGFNSFSYSLPQYGILSVNFSTTTYNWLNMPDSLTANNDDVSTLIYDCGVGQKMNYSPLNSTSQSQMIDSAFHNYFGYNESAVWKWKADYHQDQWTAMLKAELDAGRPLLYYGNDGGTDERFFICDGYSDSGSFHFNWGSGGSDNGYFLLNALTPGTHNYSNAQGAIFNLAPALPGNSLKMDFDSISDFSLSFSPWTTNDVDGDSTFGIQGHTFPNNGYPMAFIAFNPALVSPSMGNDSALQPHSGSRFGACFAGISHPNNDWFISPQIQLGTDGQFSFWERSYTDQYGLEKFNVLVSTTGNTPSDFTAISGSTPLSAPLQWTKKTFSLSAYNNQKVYVAIQCVSSNAFIFMIDDLEVKPTTSTGLSADFIANSTTIKAGAKVNFTDESSGNPIAWSWSFPGGIPSGSNQQNPSNIRYDMPGNYNVTLKISDGSTTDSVIKQGYITVTGYPSYMSLDFENLSDFTLNFNPWSVFDVNGGSTYEITNVTFPNNGSPMAYICFNPSQATPPPLNMSAHSGNKFGASFSAVLAQNNKWLISPRMSLGSDASIRFWVASYDSAYGFEKFNVGVSTTGNNPSDFVLLNTTPLKAPMEWTKESFPLSAYAGQDVYIGINCVTYDGFIFMVDDIEIGSALSVDETPSINEITVYPNPANDHVILNFGKEGRFVSNMNLINETGAVLKDLSLNHKINELFTLPLSGLASGIYYLIINSPDGRIVKKIAVVN